MSRILLLIVLVLWMARSGGPSLVGVGAFQSMAVFFGGLALIVLFMGVWSRMMARHVAGQNLHISVRRFTRAMYLARLMIPLWFAFGLFALGWGNIVEYYLGALSGWPIELPAALVGTLPAGLAWMGLWWAQYPADRALREQNMLAQLNEDLPLHRPPDFRGYLASHLRLQLLFTLVPVAMILLLRDVACVVLWRFGVIEVNPTDGAITQQGIEVAVTLSALAVVFLLAPEILRHVLRTEPLPAGALRNRLESLCRRAGLRYRQILLWHTDHGMGNAAVMGMIPQVRYILLSDLLLETMTDSQIEAVFAHEIGHVVHRHMIWYAVFLAIIMSGFLGPGQWLADQLGSRLGQGNLRDALNLLTVIAGCGGFFFLFGCLSRWFERQADVYAARTMQRYDSGLRPSDSSASASVEATGADSYVGPYGARLFASALQRVAVINNIPLEPLDVSASGPIARVAGLLDLAVEKANNWFHGSILARMNYLHDLSGHPNRTSDFDRRMSLLYAMLILALLVCGASLGVMAL